MTEMGLLRIGAGLLCLDHKLGCTLAGWYGFEEAIRAQGKAQGEGQRKALTEGTALAFR
jgi:hypothetical protein